MSRERGFTLIELLIVVAIIGVLAAIAIPNMMMALQRSKQKRSMANMRNIATAWEARATDTSRYNAAGVAGASMPVAVSDLNASLTPTYIKSIPTSDGWGRDLLFFTDLPFGDASPGSKYAIVSRGRDGTLDSTVVPGPVPNFDCDIVFANGSFLTYPADAVAK
jgi:type II secretion system protein G